MFHELGPNFRIARGTSRRFHDVCGSGVQKGNLQLIGPVAQVDRAAVS